MNIATIFAGGEGVGVGARQAGIDHLWGIEYKDDIAQVARNNGFNVITADVTVLDPSQFRSPGILHASPPCPNFSTAKTGAVETTEDIALAQATVRFIEALTPKIFTLENVWLYRRSESWRLIADTLNRLGYWMTVQHLNFADFGVPQTRKRMIVRAVRGGWLPPLPVPVPWQGWYQAVEDLLPELPDSEFASWQLERGVQDLLDETCLLSQGSFDHTNDGNDRDAQPIGKRTALEPTYTVTANSNMGGTRVFIVDSQNSRETNVTIRRDDTPMFTITATAAEKGMPRTAIPGRVVRMSPRCSARFQAVPDDYKLPDKATLAVRVIGNAVPPLMMRQLLEPFAQ